MALCFPSSIPYSLLLFLLFLLSCFNPSHSQHYHAIFSFGDSLSDAGNLIADGVPSDLTTARSPYGMTFFGRPTGRCSDGRLIVDFLAEHFGLPLPPPSKASDRSFRKGANFAITGATALDSPFFKARGLNNKTWNTGSLSTQLQWFESLKPSLCSSPQACEEYLRKSLFVFGEFGGNDYNAPLFSGKTMAEVKTYVPFVVDAITRGIERLISDGAVDVVVPGVLPIGCFPLYLTLYGSSKKADYNSRSGCLRRFNALAFHHNMLLREALEKLQTSYPEARIMYGDYYTPTVRFVLNPARFGFHNGALKACCGAGGQSSYNFNLDAKCGEKGAKACTNPSSYVSWDGIHLTEAAYRSIANGWLKGPYADPPILR
ncbi:GDSL esterase/lipase At5g45910-like [Ananas comosus]|uniref:GDSL esterase/lipase At5g45910-like n=1 Tax=Ananas comosus TaxID=4615 RepID=A0A6P5EA52_ANACO|nr:GDSL esterase/lipase At5g45910-like [Ananas comosus]